MSVDPTGNTITLKTGAGANVREQQFRVNDTTKFFGTDRQPLTGGLRFDGLKAGTDVWYQVGTGANAWAGGDNHSGMGQTVFLPGSTVTLDDKPIVENGELKL